MKHKLLRMPQVLKLTGLSRSTIYNLLETNNFPRPIRLGKRAIAWTEEQIEQWLIGQIVKSTPVVKLNYLCKLLNMKEIKGKDFPTAINARERCWDIQEILRWFEQKITENTTYLNGGSK